MIPSQGVVSYEGQRKLDTLNLDIYPGSARSELYEDAGDGYAYQRGENRRTTFTTSSVGGGGLSVNLARTGSFVGARSFRVTIHDISRPSRAVVDGGAVPSNYDSARHELTFVIPANARAIEIPQ